jgi:membrane-associated phospholipid phosphatase
MKTTNARARWTGLRVLLCCLTVVWRAAPSVAQEPPPKAQPTPPQAPPVLPGPKPHGPPDDKRRTVRSYLHNLGYNFIAVPQRENRKALLISTGLTAPSFLLDDEFKQYFVDHPHDNFGDIGATLGSSAAVFGVTVGLFSAGRISRGDRFRAATYDLSQAVIVNQAYTTALKLVVQRERPDESDNRSFPSGHASNAFTIASVFTKHYKKLSIPLYGFATFIATSRMAANKHYFSDVVAGSCLGWVIGRSVVRRNGRPPDVKAPAPDELVPHATWQVLPWAGPAGDGTGLRLVVTY